jgi:hypothetical protein
VPICVNSFNSASRQPVVAHGRAKPHIDEFRETLPGEDPQIAFESIVPLDRDIIEMERCHPNTLIDRSTHATKVYGTLVEPGQRIAFAIEGLEGDLWVAGTWVITVVTTNANAPALSSVVAAMCHKGTTMIGAVACRLHHVAVLSIAWVIIVTCPGRCCIRGSSRP